MQLNERQKRQLRGLGHKLKPVVMIGQAGLTDNVLAEIEQALSHHELIKVRINAADRAARAAMIQQISSHTGGLVIQCIGHILLLFRRNPKQPRVPLH